MDGSEPELQIPSSNERWLGAVPLILSLLIIAYVSSKITALGEPLKALRIELPLPTKVALAGGAFVNEYYFFAMPLMLALCWIHFGWAAKRRSSLIWANQIWFLLFVTSAAIFIVGPIAPWVKIDMALRMKHP